MFVNAVAFMTTLLRNIILFTAGNVPFITVTQLSNSLKVIFKLYYQGGFAVQMVLMDTEFEKVTNNLGLIEANITAA